MKIRKEQLIDAIMDWAFSLSPMAVRSWISEYFDRFVDYRDHSEISDNNLIRLLRAESYGELIKFIEYANIDLDYWLDLDESVYKIGVSKAIRRLNEDPYRRSRDAYYGNGGEYYTDEESCYYDLTDQQVKQILGAAIREHNDQGFAEPLGRIIFMAGVMDWKKVKKILFSAWPELRKYKSFEEIMDSFNVQY